jgi:recombination protein RecA
MFGNPETTTGGRALKFYASVRMDVRRIETLKQSGEMVGNRTRIKIVKNKIAPPFKEAEFDIMFGKGISKVGDILDLAVKENIIEKSGAWFAYNGSKIGQGRENSKQYLSDNPEMCAEVEAKVRTRYELPGSEETAEAEETKAKELKKGTRAEASKAPGAKTEGADTPDAPRLS